MLNGTVKISIRGTNPENTDSTIAIATINKIPSTNFDTTFSSQEEINFFMQKVQTVVSTPVKSLTISYDTDYEISVNPGNELESSEIFSDEFSDTQVVPTLQIKTSDGNTKRTFNFKYMADPTATSLEKPVTDLADILEGLTNTSFTGADLTFTARDEVITPD